MKTKRFKVTTTERWAFGLMAIIVEAETPREAVKLAQVPDDEHVIRVEQQDKRTRRGWISVNPRLYTKPVERCEVLGREMGAFFD